MAKFHLVEAIVLIVLAVAFLALISYGGWDTQAQPLVTSYNTSFWNLNQTYPPLNLNITPAGSSVFNGVTVSYSDVWFNSNIFNGSTVVIHGTLMQPFGSNLPAVLLLPNFGNTSKDLVPLGTAIASNGYAVLAIDLPGSGNSTGMIPTPESLTNLSNGPSSSYYYQSVIAASRAITALDNVSSVNPSETAVLGVSQGGVTAVQLASVDGRVKTVVSALSGGYLDENVLRGSLLGFNLTKGVSVNSQTFKDLVSYFDANAYAQQLSVPALFITGTNDQYFLLNQVNATFGNVQSQKAILLEPNQGNTLPNDWNTTILTWLDHFLMGTGATLPTPNVTGVQYINFYTALNVSTSQLSFGASSANYTGALFYRPSVPGATWSEVSLSGSSNSTGISAGNAVIPLPPLPTNFEYFVALTSNGTIVSTSTLYQTQATPSYFVIILLFVVLVGAVLAFQWWGDIAAYASYHKRSTFLLIVGVIVWAIAAFSLTQPWISTPGNAMLNVMQTWDRFPSLSSVYVILGLTLLALVGYAVRLWIGGILLILTGAVVFFATLNAFAPYGAVSFAWGAYLFAVCIAVSLLIPAILKVTE